MGAHVIGVVAAVDLGVPLGCEHTRGGRRHRIYERVLTGVPPEALVFQDAEKVGMACTGVTIAGRVDKNMEV